MWGVASCGSLGDNTLVSKSSPVQIPGTQWTDISLGLLSNFARKSDGTLWSWGFNSSGQLGQNDRVFRSSPVQIPGTQWVEISGESICNHVLARKSDGTLWAWGLNTTGQLGDITIVTRSSPVQIPGTQWTEIAVAQRGSAARKSDGTLWAWGTGDTTGQNDNIDRSSPVQIPGTQWFDITMGGNVPTAAARKAV
jgi:alpha-tubulin suppressor-like RCC1 family protein